MGAVDFLLMVLGASFAFMTVFFFVYLCAKRKPGVTVFDIGWAWASPVIDLDKYIRADQVQGARRVRKLYFVVILLLLASMLAG
jgi:hypothetical protein